MAIDSQKNRNLERVQSFLDELDWSPTQRYVEVLRNRGDLLPILRVDVDIPQIVRRHFSCDARRCIQWAGERPLVDRSCCSRYQVPMTTRDREQVMAHLPLIRRNLPPDHRLQNPEASPFEINDDLGYEMVSDNALDGCQFHLYQEGLGRCAIHLTALQQGQDPLAWKPMACALWPLAISSYNEPSFRAKERYLLTIYCDETTDLFDETDDEPFACIEDQDPSYPRLYQSERDTLESLFGDTWWHRLDAAAKQILK